MKLYPRIAARLHDEPWQMLPECFHEKLLAFEKVRASAEWMDADEPEGPCSEDKMGRQVPLHEQVEVYGPVALLKVHGMLGKGLSRLAIMCGGFDTNILRAQMKNVAEDPAIQALVLDFNSPGGMAAGTHAAADAVRAVSAAGKKVYGYASGDCASAAYYIACACDELHADPDARVGSISTVMSGVDTSRQWAMEGKELKLFATGKFKATGMDGKEWTKEEEDMIWERIGKIDAEFKGYVKARRSLAPELMEGQWWYARHAPAGLVDSSTFDSLPAFLETVFASL